MVPAGGSSYGAFLTLLPSLGFCLFESRKTFDSRLDAIVELSNLKLYVIEATVGCVVSDLSSWRWRSEPRSRRRH